MDREEARAAQRKQIWSGCQTVLGCGGLVALVALAYGGIGLVFRSVPRSPNVIVFLNHAELKNNIFWFALFGGVFVVGLLLGARSTLALVAICSIAGVMTLLATRHLYTAVAAIGFPGKVVELHYVWPRGSTRLRPEEIVATDFEQRVHGGDDALHEYRLFIRTRSREYVSFADTNLDDVTSAQKRIRSLKSGK